MAWLLGRVRIYCTNPNRKRNGWESKTERWLVGLKFSGVQAGKIVERSSKSELTDASKSVSFVRMRPDQISLRRRKLVDRLLVTGEILRGTLLQRTICSHSNGCVKCASGEGHPLWVLTVTYAGGRTKQLSLRSEQVPEVRRWLHNYQNLKDEIEAICELNQELLRANREASKARGNGDD
jgi:hypothetical protein